MGAFRCLLAACFLLLCLQLHGQTRRIFDYYDAGHRQVKQVTTVKTSKPKEPNGPYISFYQNGNVKSQGDYLAGKGHGYWTRYFENGHLQASGQFNQGVQTGYWMLFFENGCLREDGVYENGKKKGYWRSYYENGALKAEGKQIGTQQDSTWRFYHDNGRLKAICHYRLNNGFYREFYDNGKVRMQGKLKDGLSDSTWRYYYESGHLKAEGKEANGLKQGAWKFYYESGVVQSEGSFDKGVAVGVWRHYHINGNLASEGNNERGQKTGDWKFYTESGQFQGSAALVNGNGEYLEKYDNGKIKVKGQIRNGLYEGEWLYYFDDGTLEGRCLYDKGHGDYTGYYRNGRIRLQGNLHNGQKEGAWLIYNTDGSLFGLYKSYSDAAEPLQRNVVVRPDTVKIASNSDKPGIQLPKPKSRFFARRVNERQGLIVAISPLSLISNNLPISFEYYRQEKLGTELGYIIYRKPFFDSQSPMEINKEYQSGFGIYLRQKFYLPDRGRGSLYFGPGIRYLATDYALDAIFSEDSTRRVQKFRGTSTQLEFTGITGVRLHHQSGDYDFVTDFFVGLGVGFREVDLPQRDLVFGSVDRRKVYIPFRLGVSIGMFF